VAVSELARVIVRETTDLRFGQRRRAGDFTTRQAQIAFTLRRVRLPLRINLQVDPLLRRELRNQSGNVNPLFAGLSAEVSGDLTSRLKISSTLFILGMSRA